MKKYIILIISVFFLALNFFVFSKNVLAQENIKPRSYFGDFSINSSMDNDMVMDIPSMEENGKVVIHRNNLGNNQSWMFIYDPVRKAYKILSNCNTNLVLNLQRDTLKLALVGNTDSQFWIIEPTYDDYIIFRNYKNKDKVLELSGNDNDSLITVGNYDYYYPNNQKWAIKTIDYQIISDGKYTIRYPDKLSMVVDLAYSWSPHQLVLFERHTESNQLWKFTYDYRRKAYRISSEYWNDLSMVWDSNHSSNILGWQSKDYTDQYWRLEIAPDEEYIIRNLKYTENIITGPLVNPKNENVIQLKSYNRTSDLYNAGNTWVLRKEY